MLSPLPTVQGTLQQRAGGETRALTVLKHIIAHRLMYCLVFHMFHVKHTSLICILIYKLSKEKFLINIFKPKWNINYDVDILTS